MGHGDGSQSVRISSSWIVTLNVSCIGKGSCGLMVGDGDGDGLLGLCASRAEGCFQREIAARRWRGARRGGGAVAGRGERLLVGWRVGPLCESHAKSKLTGAQGGGGGAGQIGVGALKVDAATSGFAQGAGGAVVGVDDGFGVIHLLGATGPNLNVKAHLIE